ncbi:MAG: c-type cytochrome, partial [Halothiobacillaceae bacterium]
MKIVSAIALASAMTAFAAGTAIAADEAAGKQLYGSSCASCHGMNGEGQGMFP